MIRTAASLHDWYLTPPGQYLRAWEEAQLDQAVADAFGYHALQIGAARVDGLRANRMPHRWLAIDAGAAPCAGEGQPPAPPDEQLRTPAVGPTTLPDAVATAACTARPSAAAGNSAERETSAAQLVLDARALPFFEESLDLVVLPHTLEFSPDPHACLREVARVLVNEGRVVICGINPLSLWAARQWRGHAWRRLGGGDLYLPEQGEFIAPWRVADWLRLLGFAVGPVQYGCHRAATRSASWLARLAWMDRWGERLWPVLGAAYCVTAIKRSAGPTLIGKPWKALAAKGEAAVVAQRTPSAPRVAPAPGPAPATARTPP
ncbi:class I SAM-dependent methyltransferase [Comamonas serinivorans]